MDSIPTPAELRGAAAVAQSLAYVVGLAGVVAGGLLLRDGEAAMAVVVWVITFAAGAILMIAAFMVRGLVALLARMTRVESDLAVLVRRDAADEQRDLWGHRPPT